MSVFQWLCQFGLSLAMNERRRQWQLTPALLPGKSHGRRSLVGCSPWGHEELDTTERLHFHFSLACIGEGNGNPLQYSFLESQSRTWLKRLSSSSNSNEWEPQLHLIPANIRNFQSFSHFGADIVVLSFSDNQQCWGPFCCLFANGVSFFCQMPAPVFCHFLLGCQL